MEGVYTFSSNKYLLLILKMTLRKNESREHKSCSVLGVGWWKGTNYARTASKVRKTSKRLKFLSLVNKLYQDWEGSLGFYLLEKIVLGLGVDFFLLAFMVS